MPDLMSDKESYLYGTLCHLLGLSGIFVPLVGNIGGPLILWLLKRKESPFVNDQGKEAVNFQITVAICAAAAAIVSLPLRFVPLPTLSLYSVVQLANLVFVIIAAVEANKGVKYRYPFTLRLVS
jgi:uncharacterized Tic20 family protein